MAATSCMRLVPARMGGSSLLSKLQRRLGETLQKKILLQVSYMLYIVSLYFCILLRVQFLSWTFSIHKPTKTFSECSVIRSFLQNMKLTSIFLVHLARILTLPAIYRSKLKCFCLYLFIEINTCNSVSVKTDWGLTTCCLVFTFTWFIVTQNKEICRRCEPRQAGTTAGSATGEEEHEGYWQSSARSIYIAGKVSNDVSTIMIQCWHYNWMLILSHRRLGGETSLCPH